MAQVAFKTIPTRCGGSRRACGPGAVHGRAQRGAGSNISLCRIRLISGADKAPSVLTAGRGGHTIVPIMIAMRCLFIHSAKQFQERSGAGYSRLPESSRAQPLDGVNAKQEFIAPLDVYVLICGRRLNRAETGESIASTVCPQGQCGPAVCRGSCACLLEEDQPCRRPIARTMLGAFCVRPS